MYRRVNCGCGASYSTNALARSSHLRGERHFLGSYWRDFRYQEDRDRWWKLRARPFLLKDADVEYLVRDAVALAHAGRIALKGGRG